jgi:MarR family transcriptional regulator, organic hydroperoxide resistance regulator
MKQPGLRREASKIEVQLQAIRRKLRERLETEYERGGLTSPQRLVMSEVVRNEGLSLKDLSQKISLAHSTVSAIVTRLVDRGLLERRAQEPDMRLSRIFVTPQVRQFLRQDGPELTLGPLVRALANATPSERKAIIYGLDTLERLLSRP